MDWVAVVRCIFTLAGAAMLVVALRQFIRTRAFLQNSAMASGIVIALIDDREGDETSYFPKVKFKTPLGNDITFQSAMGSTSKPRSIGYSVAVRYQPDQPHVAEIDAFMTLWGLTFLFGALGLVFLFLGVGILAGRVNSVTWVGRRHPSSAFS